MYSILKAYLSERSELPESDLSCILDRFQWKKVRKNEIIIDFGEVCRYFYFINKGAVRIFTINSEGVELSRFFAFERTFCTTLPSFIDQQPAHEYLQAIERSELLVISRKDFYGLVSEYNEFDRIYREILEFSFISNQKRIYSFQGYSALEKVQLLLKMQPDFLLRVSNKLAASYLGMSPSTLSRLKSKI
ncbi:Crp/Fnr family transcriptional regulator [Sinomicrobium weinanense]|uniref:Cyclic nucleotide-binding domain-containing protein n=1 Tax=Sinomicrobium weinanense TaxID=2842200 RepID=A0A926Q243_9FLAO|nr:cyclic nucleotide-binding domain-containing protein [Sinomicrobium weinanense]MBC9796267.1 cyclic nucleotide-binding domain-containing protein [Sinomicrobium weinanense]MBU3122278.1 cyclic nucleotide-binding domain-containing protein [Sinomicrobium weinanense]